MVDVKGYIPVVLPTVVVITVLPVVLPVGEVKMVLPMVLPDWVLLSDIYHRIRTFRHILVFPNTI